MKVVFDIETDALLDNLTCLHCIAYYRIGVDTEVQGAHWNKSGSIHEAMRILQEADVLIGHNIQAFDIPALKKLFPNFEPRAEVRDTLIMSRLQHVHDRIKHSLGSWGDTFKFPKGDFHDWSRWTPEMQKYCEQDVRLNVKVWEFLDAEKFTTQSIELEHKFAYELDLMMAHGVPFDEVGARKLGRELTEDEERMRAELTKDVPPFVKETEFIPKRNNRTLGYIKDVPFIKKTYSEFNPGSRQQVVRLLQDRYSWSPSVFTEKGNPKVSADILRDLPYDIAESLADYYDVKKLLGQCKTGKASWLNTVNNGRIHGYTNHNGAVTGRCTHCVPITTKALTKTGWKPYSQIQVGDEILAYDMVTGTQKWTPVQAIHTGEGRLGYIGNQSTKLVCTEDHKWVVAKRSRKDSPSMKLLKASEILSHDAIVMNAPYTNPFNSPFEEFEIPMNKHDLNHLAYSLQMTEIEMKMYLSGFLLADGCLQNSTNGDTKSWTFSQSEGRLLENFQTLMYLLFSGRISRTCKTKLKGDNQRWGYTVRETKAPWLRAGKTLRGETGMKWTYTHDDDVWCPQTKYGTWVMMQEDGVISITGNSGPNLGQVPAVDGFRGGECRSLFSVPTGYALVGCDAQGLELRNLAHYLYPYDGGLYAREVLDGDIHTSNQEAAGLETRPLAKRFIYAFLYGAGDEKLGYTLGATSQAEAIAMGKTAKAKFFAKIPAIQMLLAAVKQRAKLNGFLRGLDGRRLYVHSDHVALNVLLQGAGAVLMKQATVMCMEKIREEKLDARLVLHVHDEMQIMARDEDAERVGEIAEQSITDAGKHLNFKIRMTGEAKIGTNWKETH